MRSRSLGADPLTGVDTIFHPSHDGNSFTIETKYDAEALARENYLLRNEASDRGDMRMVARVPLVVLAGLEKRGIVRGTKILDQKAYKKWLNSDEAKLWRTDNSRV